MNRYRTPTPFGVVAIGLLAFLPACSPKVQTRLDTGPIPARTFAFVARDTAAPSTPDDMDRVHAAVQEAITNTLAAKGVTRVTSSPDVLVAYLIVIGDQNNTRVVDTYFGRGRPSGDLLNKAFEAYGKRDTLNLEAGTLLIDVLSGRNAALLWRSHATRTILQNPTPSLRAANIQSGVDEALKDLRFTH